MKTKDISWILVWLGLVSCWILYAKYIVQSLMEVPIWTAGGLLAFIGAFVLGVIMGIGTVIIFLATFD